MTKLALLCNRIFIIAIIGWGIYIYFAGKISEEGLGGFILFLTVIVAFLICNIRALRRKNQYDGQPQGLLTNIPLLLFNSFLIIAIVFFWVGAPGGLEILMGLSSILLVPLTTIIALKGEGIGRVLGFTSLYFKRRKLEEELRVRELEEKLNKKKEDDI
jgi:hypothetical protein